ncbi:tRNA dihydrouridine synthase DusB [Candidatus Avelusimicrobium gallicola]|uniref:tRNA-dihydrouridine synthase n=1 Tax=Candidatus Avelusimicrobium gallicola TaxID=2562704 RepID=A0A1Y4DEK6_9BACT|nr:tRNA dihydrouridine synthase DusB [Elusimicrobium sp. An273]OUO57517.1 tRNA dihydrouridine synthase DusB [Elusimicrobium sp. An273]
MNYIHPLQIGSFTAANNLLLAPMAGITDSPFRVLCLKGGAGIVCAEMVSAHALHYGNAKSGRMLQVNPKEHPVSMQIFGSDEATIAEAARNAEAQGADIVDLNAGCPVKKINKAGAGCVLMKDEAKLGRLIEAAVKSVKIPVTLKTRIALTHKALLGARLAKLAQNAGASAVTLHARAAVDVHSGPPNIEAVAEACSAVTIPVIGNGGILTADTARQFLQAGCAGVMIGRGAVGNPFIFQDIQDAFAGKEPSSHTPKSRLAVYLDLIRENVAYYGERIGVNRSRKTAGYWIKDFPNAAEVRGLFVRLDALADIEKLFTRTLQRL